MCKQGIDGRVGRTSVTARTEFGFFFFFPFKSSVCWASRFVRRKYPVACLWAHPAVRGGTP